jgi:hypothetical protein
MASSIVVIVATNRGHGSYRGKAIEDARIADISRVNDEIAALERSQCFRAQKSMGVGNQTDGY